MLEKVNVTGKFFDLYERPLQGEVIFSIDPEYVLDQPEDAIYLGQVTGVLDSSGSLNVELIASQGWQYRVDFNLRTQDGKKATMRRAYAEFPEDGALPDFIIVNGVPGSSRPVILFTPGDGGTVNVSGAKLDPSDNGAILVPVSI